MKKIFKVILLIFPILIITKVMAKSYGLEYKPIENLDLKVEEVKKYHFYKENKIEVYFIEEENPSIFKKQNNYYFTNYSEWFKEKPSIKKNREIKERNVYVYSKLKKIKNFYIEVLDSDLSIKEFSISFNDLTASNNAYCSDCSNYYYMHMTDSDLIKINELTLKYDDFYEPNSLKIRVLFNKENIKYRIIIFDNNINEILYEGNFISDTSLHEYTIDDFDLINAFEEETIKYSEDPNMYLVDSFKEYSYRDKLYLYEYILKDYYPTYEVSLDGYIKDEDDFIIEKKYYYLETAIIKDKIVITNENYDLNDYIKTSVPFEVASNINISKNGTYKVKYIFPNKAIEVDAKVNTNNEYIETLNQNMEKKNEEIKDIILDKDEIISHLEESIKNKDEVISKKQVERSIVKTSKIPIVLITIGVMLIIICISSSIKKTVELKK